MIDTEEISKTLKTLGLMAWFALVLVGGYMTAHDHGTYVKGAGAMLLAFLVPAIGMKVLDAGRGLWQRYKHRNDDEAVSPVIAVILMVAITVVLAATVWVWVSGFGTPSVSNASLGLSSDAHSAANATFTVVSASGLDWEDVSLHVDGSALAYANLTTAGTTGWCIMSGATCYASAAAAGAAGPGQKLYVTATAGQTVVVSGPDQALVSIIAR